MAFVSDNEIDLELGQMKELMQTLFQNQRTFANTFQTMKPRDRALMVSKIESDQKQIAHFIEKTKSEDIINSGTKFSLENLRQRLMTAKVQWKKTLSILENMKPTSTPNLESPRDGSENETVAAIKQYEKTLRGLGHNVSEEHLKEFKTNLDSAFRKAKELAGGKDLAIKIVEESGKIKVRMMPK